ncbi:MAG: amino acid adenylation domain-containing protein [Gammaproteobacteria bacterium]|nr:amino acid adenylation domain-containing protein [Gammaproteobacteria bacterium]
MPSLLHELLLDSAQRGPEKTAIHTAKAALSYAELADRAGKLNATLQGLGARNGDRIGLLADKNVDCYVGVYGIMMAGCAYVPLDRRAPAERLSYIIGDCAISTLVCTAKGIKPLLASPDALETVEHVIILDGTGDEKIEGCKVLGPADVAAQVAAPPAHTVDTDLCYILYTSGSTGQPKGVMISHAVSMSFVRWAANQTGLTATDRVSGHAPLHFDLSVFDIYSTAKAGATLYPVPDGASTFPGRLTDWMVNNEISVWYSVPSILSMMAKQGSFAERKFPDLRVLLFAGEVFPVKYLKQWLKQCPDTVFMNWYGPTETNVCTSYTVDISADEIDKPVPIGKATSSAALFRVDADGNPIDDPDTVGELLARGPCVAIGYWGDQEKTRSRFIGNSAQPWLADRVYRTGDLVSMDADGNYIYQGRADHQVKCRGYRIELGEVETALYRDKSIQEAAVVPVPDDVIGNRLVAFVSSPKFADSVPDTVVDYIKTFLPPYMLPDRYIVMPELPKTSNGKVDRQSLLKTAESLS